MSDPLTYWFKRFMERGYKESGRMPVTEEQRRLIDLYLSEIESMCYGLDSLADRLDAEGFVMVAAMVRDSQDMLMDIAWMDFTEALLGNDEDEPEVTNINVVNTELGGNVDNG